MNQNKRSFVGGLVTGIMVALLLGCGYFAGKQLYNALGPGRAMQTSDAGSSNTAVANAKTVQKMDVLEDMIGEYYLDDVDETALEQGVYRGMIGALGDPYSVYYSAEELKDLQEKTQGIYYGIGARVSIDQDTMLPCLVSIIENTPAEAAGLMAGDLLYKVDDTEVKGMDLTSAVALVKGDEGTTVHLTVIREGESDYLEFDVVRRKLDNITVEQEMLEDGIGYIEILEFDDVTLAQFTDALAVCRGSGMKGLILDLRSNPGGNLDTVCEISRMMLPKGLIVYTEDKYGERVEYTCDGSRELDVPLVVLVDGNSASASEILAGAIKDYGIGTLVGTTTFGKGIVQRVIQLSDGSAVKLTVSNYFTPNGNNIHKIGIAPDVEVPFDSAAYLEDGTDNQLDQALEIMREKLQ